MRAPGQEIACRLGGKVRMSRLSAGLIGLVAGFVTGALLAGGAVTLFSANTHDKSLEAAMTAFFAGGPAGAALGILVAWVWRRRHAKSGS